MADQGDFIQEKLHSKPENENPEYQELVDAYFHNPFYDLTRSQIQEYARKKNGDQKETQNV